MTQTTQPSTVISIIDHAETAAIIGSSVCASLVDSTQQLSQDIQSHIQDTMARFFSHSAHTQDLGDPDLKKGIFTCAQGTKEYLLFTPPNASSKSKLIVMLHGCKQSAADFALGTQMNALASQNDYYVHYPQQDTSQNPHGCWNWFVPSYEVKGLGEAGLLAQMTQKIVIDHKIDKSRVFVAGLSAGGAMAHILAHTYPEVYKGAGIHSGVGIGLAKNGPQALSVMRQGPSGDKILSHATQSGVPQIIFQGAKDTVVHPKNADAMVEMAVKSYANRNVVESVIQNAALKTSDPATPTKPQSSKPKLTVKHSVGAKNYDIYSYKKPDGTTLLEYWRVGDLPHAWSGGHPKGSYTLTLGPDASRQVVRFFEQIK